MDEQKVSEFEARYSPLDDEELVEMANRRSTLVAEAVVALNRVIGSRNLNISSAAHGVAEEQVVEEHASHPSRATYLLHSLALALSIPLVHASGFGGAIPVILVGAFAWWVSVQLTKSIYEMHLSRLKRTAALWGMAVLYVVAYFLLYSLIVFSKR